VPPLAANFFVPKPSAQNPGAPFRLTGVVYSQSESYCLLNGKVLKQGESVGGAIVEKITPNSVTLSRDGEIITVPVTVN
jgi:type II secretory pathway component PulC